MAVSRPRPVVAARRGPEAGAAAEGEWARCDELVRSWLKTTAADQADEDVSTPAEPSVLLLVAQPVALLLENRDEVVTAAAVARSASDLMDADAYQGWSVEPECLRDLARRLPDPVDVPSTERSLRDLLTEAFLSDPGDG